MKLPATTPPLLIPLAARLAVGKPPSPPLMIEGLPRSSVAGLIAALGAVRNAWVTPLAELLEPATWPELLMAVAVLETKEAPRTPRSSVAGFIGVLGAVRKACKEP